MREETHKVYGKEIKIKYYGTQIRSPLNAIPELKERLEKRGGVLRTFGNSRNPYVTLREIEYEHLKGDIFNFLKEFDEELESDDREAEEVSREIAGLYNITEHKLHRIVDDLMSEGLIPAPEESSNE